MACLKTKNIQKFIMLSLIACLSGLINPSAQARPDTNKLHHFRLLAFGTYIEVMISGGSDKQARQARNLVRQKFKTMHHQWHSTHDSAVSRLNRQLPGNRWVALDPVVQDLIVRSKQISILSQHKFNPAIGKLVNIWGFNNALKPRIKPPLTSKINALTQQQARMSDVQIQDHRIHSSNPAVQLDFGAIAKGYAIDQVVRLLKKRGFKNFIINAGGDLKAIGRRPARAWRIAVRDPSQKSKVIAGIEIINEEAVFTSGDYERYFMHKGTRYHHIIDPATGYPAQQTRSVTVIHKNATLADAAATALFIAGPKNWVDTAKKMGIRYVMLVDNKGIIHLSRAMHQRIQLLGKSQRRTLVRDLNNQHSE